MSKIDAQRAMWKQRYERRQAAAAAQPGGVGPRPPVAPPAAAPASATLAPPRQVAPQQAGPEQAGPELAEAELAEAEQAGPEQTEPAEELGGHRNTGGRTCTRERGHTAKSHRTPEEEPAAALP